MMKEEVNKSMRALGIDPASGRLSSTQYWAVLEELQRKSARALANSPGLLHTAVTEHIKSIQIGVLHYRARWRKNWTRA